MRHTVLGLIVALGITLHPVPPPWHATCCKPIPAPTVWTSTPVAPVITKSVCVAVKRVHHKIVCTRHATVHCTNGACVG